MDPIDYEKLKCMLLGHVPMERGFWLSRTVEERAIGIELLRQITYGYDPATAKVERVLNLEERDFPGEES